MSVTSLQSKICVVYNKENYEVVPLDKRRTMSKALPKVELPTGIYLLNDGRYRGRFKYQGEKYSLYNRDLEILINEIDDLKYELRHGLKGRGDKIILNEWFALWLNTRKKRTIKESTYVRYQDYYDHYIKEELGRFKLVDINLINVEKMLQDLAEKNYATKTIRDIYNILNAMLKYAVNARMLIHNPCAGAEVPITTTKEIRVLTIDEQREVLQFAKGRIHENAIRVALGTGLRVGELLGLQWSDIDFKNREISINKTLVYIKDRNTGKYTFKYQTPKTKKSIRTIPMQESVYDALRRQSIQLKEMKLAANDWETSKGFENLVFVSRTGKPLYSRSVQVCLDWIEKAINKTRKIIAEATKTEYKPIPHFHCHTCRHTFATRCFEAGIDAKVVQGYLGHSSIAITLDLYTHVTDDKAKTEMSKLETLYQGII